MSNSIVRKHNLRKKNTQQTIVRYAIPNNKSRGARKVRPISQRAYAQISIGAILKNRKKPNFFFLSVSFLSSRYIYSIERPVPYKSRDFFMSLFASRGVLMIVQCSFILWNWNRVREWRESIVEPTVIVVGRGVKNDTIIIDRLLKKRSSVFQMNISTCLSIV